VLAGPLHTGKCRTEWDRADGTSVRAQQNPGFARR
jgi:hypothetical protein